MSDLLCDDAVLQDDPELWDEDRLREELSEMAKALQSAEHYRDKYDRRRQALTSAIAPVVRAAEQVDGHVVVPLAVWEGFTSDLAAISYGRIPEPRA